MSEYIDLLLSVGIMVNYEDLFPEPDYNPYPSPNSPNFPNTPHHYDDYGTAVFTGDQLAIGNPEDFGFIGPYLVTELSQQYALNWCDERTLTKKRPIHRYSLHDRFKCTIGQLTSSRGTVPQKIIDHFKALQVSYNEMTWEVIRYELKVNGWQIYYNRIPGIINQLKLAPSVFIPTDVFTNLMRDFDKMTLAWNHVKDSCGRKYFPNLRYIALRLLDKHGVKTCCKIPLARTLRKKTGLGIIYDKIWEHINKL